MQGKELEKLLYESCRVVTATGKFICDELGSIDANDIKVKSKNSLVSYVDTTAEQQLVEGLGKLLPGSTFITEEDTVENVQGEYCWIIDPLDGTTNFLHNLPFFAVSAALQHNGETILGIVYEPNHSDCFFAHKGGGAKLNGKPIKVNDTQEYSDALIATGFPYYDYDRIAPFFETLKHFSWNTRGIRRFGAAALDLAYVAAGRFDAFFEYSLHAWDVAAGALLVEEAGGKVSDFSGGDNYLFGKEIIATTPQIYDKVRKVIMENFGE